MPTHPSTSGQPPASPQPEAARRSLSTRDKSTIALSVPCDVHQVPAGQPCPLIELQACMARRTTALGDS